MKNPRAAELGTGSIGAACRSCKHVRAQRVADAVRHVCVVTEPKTVTIQLGYRACGRHTPIFGVLDRADREADASGEARSRAKAKLTEKLAAAGRPRSMELFE